MKVNTFKLWIVSSNKFNRTRPLSLYMSLHKVFSYSKYVFDIKLYWMSVYGPVLLAINLIKIKNSINTQQNRKQNNTSSEDYLYLYS